MLDTQKLVLFKSMYCTLNVCINYFLRRLNLILCRKEIVLSQNQPQNYSNAFLCSQANLTHLSRNTFVPGIGMGIAKCPYDPADNSTAVWVEKGNPGDLPGLYSGTNAEFTKADTVIFRTDLHNLTTGRKEFTFKRTLKYDSKWLDSKLHV